LVQQNRFTALKSSQSLEELNKYVLRKIELRRAWRNKIIEEYIFP
jgi:hypothetical protein